VALGLKSLLVDPFPDQPTTTYLGTPTPQKELAPPSRLGIDQERASDICVWVDRRLAFRSQ
jgi:hypothetical protein